MGFSQSLVDQAERSITDVSEGHCPICRDRLVIHGGAGCCPCCGGTFRAGPGLLEMGICEEHRRACGHFEALWESRKK